MSSIAFDNTMLSVILNPNGRVPDDPDTRKPVEYAKDRADALIQKLEKDRRKIILPTPACAELLTAIGPDAQSYINLINRYRVFEVASFDPRAANELALLNRDLFREGDQNQNLDPYQKVKFDRQILAICRVAGVTELHTDDKGLASRARLCGIAPVRLKDLPLPDFAKEPKFDLAPHPDIPEDVDG